MDDTLFNMLDFAGIIAGEKQTEKQYSFFFRMPSLLNIHGKTKKQGKQPASSMFNQHCFFFWKWC
jgi:hypothetical protein